MPSIVSDRFRILNARKFISEIPSESKYLFIGKISPWDGDELNPTRPGTDTIPPIPYDSEQETGYSHWSDMLSLKRVQASNVKHMIRRYDWTSGVRYDAYDPNDIDLFRKAFYVMTDQIIGSSTVYRVYKCLVRPANGGSVNKPTHNTSAVVTENDGYAWKFMYELDQNDVLNFLTPQHIPVPDVKNSGNIANAGPSPFPLAENGVVGHGYDPVRELGAYFVGVQMRLEFDEQGFFTTENDYRKIGIIDRPRVFGSTTNIATADRYRQTFKLTLAAQPPTAFTPDSIVSGTGFTARVVGHFTDDITGDVSTEVFVQLLTGSFPSPTFAVTDGTNSYTVSAVENPGLNDETGDVLFVEYRKPIPRSPDQVESLTLVLEF